MKRLAFCVLACTALAGCATYTWRDQSFTSKQDALAAVQKSQAEILAKVEPLPKPVAKQGKFVGVSRELMTERGTVGTNMDVRDYIGAAAVIQMRAVYDALVKRNIFEKLDFVVGDGADSAPVKDEAVIYFYLPDSKTGGYYFVSPAVKKTPVNFDRGNPDIPSRTKYFVDSVEALASIKK